MRTWAARDSKLGVRRVSNELRLPQNDFAPTVSEDLYDDVACVKVGMPKTGWWGKLGSTSYKSKS